MISDLVVFNDLPLFERLENFRHTRLIHPFRISTLSHKWLPALGLSMAFAARHSLTLTRSSSADAQTG
jgi:hypothetical protein